MLRQRSSERGAVLVHVAIMLLALVTLSGFVIDYGVFWVARRQAQNAADAGAHAAAVSLSDGLNTDEAHDAALATTKLNNIWGETLSDEAIAIGFSGSIPLGSPELPETCNASNCVRVSVFRDNEPGRTPLPTYFLKLANVTHQDVRATAVAKVAGANSVQCLMPLILADRWIETTGNANEYNPGDEYTPGGYTLGDISQDITLSKGPSTVPTWDSFFVIEVDDDGQLDQAMMRCTLPGSIGQTVTPGLQDVNFSLDENFESLRDQVVYFPVYNPEEYLDGVLRITNIIPFRVKEGSISGGGGGFEITGRFLKVKGDLNPNGELPPPGSEFLSSVQLIR